jgi:hypothetical protein
MKMELNYLASKKWEKVGRQELRSIPYEQEIDPWSYMPQPVHPGLNLKENLVM